MPWWRGGPKSHWENDELPERRTAPLLWLPHHSLMREDEGRKSHRGWSQRRTAVVARRGCVPEGHILMRPARATAAGGAAPGRTLCVLVSYT